MYVFLCMFQTGRWKWRRRVWSSARWGQERCLESWLFSTTAPGLPLSRVSVHRRPKKTSKVLPWVCALNVHMSPRWQFTCSHIHSLKSVAFVRRIRGFSAGKQVLRRHGEREGETDRERESGRDHTATVSMGAWNSHCNVTRSWWNTTYHLVHRTAV